MTHARDALRFGEQFDEAYNKPNNHENAEAETELTALIDDMMLRYPDDVNLDGSHDTSILAMMDTSPFDLDPDLRAELQALEDEMRTWRALDKQRGIKTASLSLKVEQRDGSSIVAQLVQHTNLRDTTHTMSWVELAALDDGMPTGDRITYTIIKGAVERRDGFVDPALEGDRGVLATQEAIDNEFENGELARTMGINEQPVRPDEIKILRQLVEQGIPAFG